MENKISRLNVAEHLLEYQLEMIGKTVQEAKKDDMWYFNWTITQARHDEFKAYAIPLLKKVLKCNKSKAENIFGWFDLQFGLKIKENE
jgi:hypothetical protein